MKIDTDYQTAMADHPVEAQGAIDKLRKSRSKFRRADPKTLKWTYDWGVEVRGHSFQDLLNGRATDEAEGRRAMSLQQRIDDELRRVRAFICVHTYGVALSTVPQEIVDIISRGKAADLAEEVRVASLSDGERAAEVEGLLGQLRGSPGFAEIRLGRDK